MGFSFLLINVLLQCGMVFTNSNYAENNSEFILDTVKGMLTASTVDVELGEVWSSRDVRATIREKIPLRSEDEDGGVYIIYVKDPSNNKRYVVYIGITMQPFQTRQLGHADVERVLGRLLRKGNHNKFPKNAQPGLKVHVQMSTSSTANFGQNGDKRFKSAVISKFIESMFLIAFDFSMNAEEQSRQPGSVPPVYRRENIVWNQQNDMSVSKQLFDEASYNDLKTGIDAVLRNYEGDSERDEKRAKKC